MLPPWLARVGNKVEESEGITSCGFIPVSCGLPCALFFPFIH